ncbi:hypothetical protein [Paeniglutamicibacter sp. NPDC091659]|uniref:hypothetical protein n=1 Tax=Paeniglutamicibacter sp. NPDC091659 TaxID=3364389 RepID=UPI0038060892
MPLKIRYFCCKNRNIYCTLRGLSLRYRLPFFALLICFLFPAVPAFAATNINMENGSPEDSPAESGIGLRSLDNPAAAQNDPHALSSIIEDINPGKTIKRRVEIVNGTAHTREFWLYPAAVVKNGSFSHAPGDLSNELTTWTSVDKPRLIIKPGNSARAMVTIDVPADASEGEKHAVLWAEVQSPESATGIVHASKTGVRMNFSVGPEKGQTGNSTTGSLTPGHDSSGDPTATMSPFPDAVTGEANAAQDPVNAKMIILVVLAYIIAIGGLLLWGAEPSK